ncbi:MAG: peptidoglycan DD-metalloendopeptidase family protein, partial [Blautia massiliensis (ex Durand et al. 2017)]
RTHNGADYAAAEGDAVTPVQPGKVTNVSEDALWGGVVEVTDADGLVWRYCGLTDPEVKTGDEVSAADTLGKVGQIPAELHGEPHVHLECLKDGAYQDPAA